MTKPTGRPVGRPKTKEYKTLLARVPQDLVDRVQHYAGMHRSTIAELIRDGLEWRITEGDPRGGLMYHANQNGYSSNTVIETAGQSADFQLPGMLDAQEEEDVGPVARAEPVPPTPCVADSPIAPGFDTQRFFLGVLCGSGHAYPGTGQSLRKLSGKQECQQCCRDRDARYKQRQRQAAAVACEGARHG